MGVNIKEFRGMKGSNDFIGINETGMASLKADLQALEKGVEATLDQMAIGIPVGQGFQGEQFREAVKKFVTAISTEAKEWASQINVYCARIDTVLEAMKGAQTQLASGLDESTHSVSNQTQMYNYGGGSSSAS